MLYLKYLLLLLLLLLLLSCNDQIKNTLEIGKKSFLYIDKDAKGHVTMSGECILRRTDSVVTVRPSDYNTQYSVTYYYIKNGKWKYLNRYRVSGDTLLPKIRIEDHNIKDSVFCTCIRTYYLEPN